tara:strand:- start:13469 stop:14617 length:1149 start_codon:yes stop_codon:yes gene_type:complete
MAYEQKPGRGTSIPERGGIQTLNSLKKRINEIVQESKFYELEPVEVLEVHLDDTKSSFPTIEGEPDYAYIGGVIGRFVFSEQGLNIDRCKNFKPLNPNMNITPAVGEIVIGVKYLSDYYFTSAVNLFGNPNLNVQHGVSRIKRKNTLSSKQGITTPAEENDTNTNVGYYLDDGRNKDARKILPNEGDIILEGRFGNSIRIGSDLKNGNTESPNIILNVGQTIEGDTKVPIEEKIDTDGSSIYLTTNQTLDFTPAIESKVITGEMSGKNILLSSDRILFNSKEKGDIGMFSANNISLGSVGKIVMESPEVKIGGDEAEEPQVLGQTLFDKLDALVTAIGNVVGIPTPTGPTPAPISAAPSWPAVTAAMAQVKLALSKKHKINE